MMLLSLDHGSVEIPAWVVDWESYGEWLDSGEVPEGLKVHFINGQVWMEPMEELFSHNRVKTSLVYALEGICQSGDVGVIFSDGATVTNEEAQLNSIPDLTYISADSLRTGRVRFVAGRKTGARATKILGSPDLVVEIVSRSSVAKDLDHLMTAYYAAGIREYWTVDARDRTEVDFTIHRHTAKGFLPVRKLKGWSKSEVFERSFKLTCREKLGLENFALESK